MNRLFLIDGHALIFRMYYAFLRRRPMINSRGEDTSVLFGFTKYLLELIRKEQPTHVAVMFDPPAKTFRHELDPQYKATRSAAPEQVKAALEPLTEIVKALNIPVLMKPGYEADDVIGTVAKKFASRDCDVYMVTPDKDLGQMIDEHIFQYKPGKGGDESEIVSKEAVCEHYGISSPQQIIDILTIWGDASDNVKGVDGVGEVGARKLVSKYGSVEGIQAHLDELPEKQREAFVRAADHLPLSRRLVTIATDVELDVTRDDLLVTSPDMERISKLFERFEFNSLRNLLPGGVIAEAHKPKEIVFARIPEEKLFQKAVQERKVAVKIGADVVLAVGQEYCRVTLNDAAQILADKNIAKIGFALKNTAVAGDVYDIEIMHYLLNPERSHKLESLALTYLDADIKPKDESVQAMLFDFEDDTPVRECVAAWMIEPFIRKELEEENLLDLYVNIEMPLIEVLADMEDAGVKIDSAMLASYRNQLGAELARIEAQAREFAGEPELNLSSPKQIGQLLFEKLAIDPRAKKNSHDNYTTDEETLTALVDRHPVVPLILEFREVKKLLSTYVEPLPRMADSLTGRVHTTFNQALTATGRLSSVQPNLQNIPIRSEKGMRIREAFVPATPDGCIVSADYSQIELRVMAHLSGDPHLIESFTLGEDVHRSTAARIFHVDPQNVTAEQRRQAKVANFGIIYGISPFGLSQRMGIPRSEAKSFIEGYFRGYPEVKDYIDRAVSSARERGYVETVFGRKRFLPDINSRNQTVRGLAERNAVNAPVQGSAADIIKLAMINVFRRFKEEGLKSRMVLQVHDELVFDVVAGEREKVMETVKREMENVCRLSVPLTVECNYGKNWREAH
ncbi:MAG: DNA polymerase I [Bacteroidales bacterium]|nr:DNA polymerase I [Candidatus Cacconaster equi]